MDEVQGREGTEWRTGERLTLRVLTIYRDSFGSLDSLFQPGDLPPPGNASLNAYIEQLTVSHLARLSGRAIGQLAAHDSQMLGRPGMRRYDWRIILYSLSGARTLREAISRCAECFEAIDWRCGRMTLSTRADMAELALDSMRPPGQTVSGCLIDLFGVTHIHTLLSWLIGRPIAIRHVALDHEEVVFRALDLPELMFNVRLADGWTGFAFDAAMLDYPVVRSADELATRPPGNLLFGMGPMDDGPAADIAEQVRRIALRSLCDRQRMPAFEEITATMGGSGPTLRRRLAREGTSYRQIRESCRREVALDLLSRTVLSIEAIAVRLDYCDSDAFRQAFREWTGMSPSGYRRAMRLAA